MKLSVMVVDINYIQRTWPEVKGYIASALATEDFPEWSEAYTIDHVLGFLASGEWRLIVAIDESSKIHGCATVGFANYPLHRVAFITTIGGRLIASKDTFEQFKNILRGMGATKIQGLGKPSIVRLWQRLGFEPRLTLVEAPL